MSARAFAATCLVEGERSFLYERRQPRHVPGLTVRRDQPLIGVVFIEDSQEATRSFADETEADAAVASQATDARVLAGVWSDLDWRRRLPNSTGLAMRIRQRR